MAQVSTGFFLGLFTLSACCCLTKRGWTERGCSGAGRGVPRAPSGVFCTLAKVWGIQCFQGRSPKEAVWGLAPCPWPQGDELTGLPRAARREKSARSENVSLGLSWGLGVPEHPVARGPSPGSAAEPQTPLDGMPRRCCPVSVPEDVQRRGVPPAPAELPQCLEESQQAQLWEPHLPEYSLPSGAWEGAWEG